MKTYIIFFNRNGNKKMAIELSEKTTVYEMEKNVSKLVDGLCSENNYTFSYANVDKNNDVLGVLKNLPILTVAKCL